jgi:hypothetical protein
VKRWIVLGLAALALIGWAASSSSARTLHYEVNVTVTGPGQVTAPAPDPTSGSIDCPGNCSALIKQGTTFELTETPDSGAEFTSWGGDCSGSGSTCTLSVDGAKSVTAGFGVVPPPPPKFTLTVAKAGTGTGYVGGAGSIDCGPVCSATLQEGSTMTLLAVPDEGSIFAGWGGGGCSGTDKCTVTLTADTNVSALFFSDRGPPHIRTIRGSGAQGATTQLRFRVYDDSGMTREVLTVLNGKATIGRVAVGMAVVHYTAVYSAAWRVPRKQRPGSRLYCAVAFDPSGHASKRVCSPFSVT